MFYKNKSANFYTNRLINLAENLNYLDCIQVVDVLIILKHQNIIWDYFNFGIKFKKHLKDKYDKIEIKENIWNSALHNKAYFLEKQYIYQRYG